MRRRGRQGAPAGGQFTAATHPEVEAEVVSESEPSHVTPVCVTYRLKNLQGPTTGVVVLPKRLDRWAWYPSHDLSNLNQLRTLYATVLSRAESKQDLATYLNRDLLIREWANLDLPGPVRTAWEAVHPLLRPKTAEPEKTEPQRYYMNGGWMDDEYDMLKDTKAGLIAMANVRQERREKRRQARQERREKRRQARGLDD